MAYLSTRKIKKLLEPKVTSFLLFVLLIAGIVYYFYSNSINPLDVESLKNFLMQITLSQDIIQLKYKLAIYFWSSVGLFAYYVIFVMFRIQEHSRPTRKNNIDDTNEFKKFALWVLMRLMSFFLIIISFVILGYFSVFTNVNEFGALYLGISVPGTLILLFKEVDTILKKGKKR